jgi:hypothetical protein
MMLALWIYLGVGGAVYLLDVISYFAGPRKANSAALFVALVICLAEIPLWPLVIIAKLGGAKK